MFDELVQHVGPRITGPGTNYHQSLLPGLKVALTLWYLATGDSYQSMAYAYRVHHTTVSLIVPDVCQAIVDEFKEEVFQTPTTPQEWKEVADGFWRNWQLPHTMGANSGSKSWCV